MKRFKHFVAEGWISSAFKFKDDSPIEIPQIDDEPNFDKLIRRENQQKKRVEEHGKGFKYTPEQQKHLDQYVKNESDPTIDHNMISSAIKDNQTSQDAYVYRGLGNMKGLPKEGDEVAFDRHTSTSYHPGIAAGRFLGMDKNNPEANHFYRIKVPKGTHAAHLADKGEYEMLLHKGAKVKVNSIKHKQDADGNYHLIDAELVHDGASK